MKRTIAFITAFLITVSAAGASLTYAADTQQNETAAEQAETEASDTVEPEKNDDDLSESEDTASDEQEEPQVEPAEIFNPEAFVKRIYTILLGREADSSGLATWTDQLGAGNRTASDVVKCIVDSEEFKGRKHTDSEYADILLLLMTGEECTEEEHKALTDRLASGYTRDEIVKVLESNEKYAKLCEKYGVKSGSKIISDDLLKFAVNIIPDNMHEAEKLIWKLHDENITAADVLADFFAEKKYSEGNEGIREYIRDLYTYVLLKQEVSDSDIAACEKYYDYGMSEKFIFSRFISSSEFSDKCSAWEIKRGSVELDEYRDQNENITHFIQRIYNICLGRKADTEGLNAWTGQLVKKSLTASEIMKFFITSKEYTSSHSSDEEYIAMLFRLLLDREAEESEIKEAVAETLSKGYVREAVLRKYTLSDEFTKMCSDYGVERGEIKIGGWSKNSAGFKCYVSPESGHMVTGDQIVTGIHCYFDNEGSLRTDWSDLKTFVNTSNALYSYADMVEDVVSLQQQYPSLVSINTIGGTADGRQIYDMMIGSPSADRQIVIQAGCHAREYMGCQLIMAQTERFLKSYWSGSYNGRSYSSLLENYCIHIIPMMNPDGITLSQYGLDGINNPSIRTRIKNIYLRDLREKVTTQNLDSYLRSWKSNALGVDLNRNFDSNWANQKEIGRPSQTGFPGRSAASENEVKAVTGLVESLRDVQAVISYHSSGSYIYWAYGQTGAFRTACSNMAVGLRNVTNYYLLSQDDFGGGCSNWVAGKGIRAATIEIGTGDSPLPISQFSDIYERNRNVIPYLLSMSLYNPKTPSEAKPAENVSRPDDFSQEAPSAEKENAVTDGWYRGPEGTFYYQGGRKVCSELKNIDGYTYYFDENGRFGNGWYTISGKRYYVSDGFIFPSNGTDWGTEFGNRNIRSESGNAVKMDIPMDFQFLYNRVICTVGGSKKTVNSSGCGATSASMVIRYLTGETKYDPETLFEWAYRNGEYYGYGLAESTVSKFVEMAGIKNYWIQPSAEKVTEALRDGKPVVALVREGYFTTGGHYIVLTGVTEDGYITVNDPNNSTLCRFEFRLDSVLKQAKCFMICEK